ncbi:iron-containing alcohol dehydrogenase [Bifidobacterium catulorum]|uniref:Alcohol dehydrogenase n=1 Tax=Bifidobacterium catulorum TaxID=1630173 RepID=A0A2U2MRR5_9BIFI|nr:iron-containing alcohol dehydrogenase [Bifidobacterium catulorum]PWG59519.1 alcohol dehydrogenase [Bifidobacterium catulorum]
MEVKMLQKVKVVCTDDLGGTLLEILNAEGYRRPLFVTDSFVATMPLVVAARRKLADDGIDCAVFDEVRPDPLCETVAAGVEAFRAHEADSIIAIGGGSSMDVARGVNIVRVNGGEIIDYTDPNVPIADCPGMIAVPTTSGTGSEVSNALVVTDGATQRKLAVLADPAVSEYAVLNPDLTIGLPPRMTIASGLDAFCHAAEGYLSRMASPITDAVCEKVMFLLYNYLPRAVRNGEDREARERVMVAATLAGWMLNNAGTIAGHSIAHVLGSKYHIVHGEAVGYALPGVMEFVAPVMPHKVREIGQILGAVYPENAPEEQTTVIAVRAFKEFRDRMLGLHPFEDYGIDRDELLANAQAVAYERFAGNTPRDIGPAEARQLLEAFGVR